MSATWAQTSHLRHPWYHTFAAKRKVCTGSTTGSCHVEDDESTDVARPVKRRRCSALERGFAHLSLTRAYLDDNQAVSSTVGQAAERPEDMEVPMDSDLPMFTGVGDLTPDMNTVITPSYVEEPAPAVSDAKMRSSTWYELEPDRIVITELETSSDEESDANNDGPERGGLYVSPTLLGHIRSRMLGAGLLLPKHNTAETSASKALVLFRPIPYSAGPSANDTAQTTEEAWKPIPPTGIDHREEDAMDLDP
ncbi:hypothetical protein AX15_007070 [Amanita polypyramis BW_CC]|nr:hypothetical protein AX15_007070 [Amanita polypyramis BW_CC]